LVTCADLGVGHPLDAAMRKPTSRPELVDDDGFRGEDAELLDLVVLLPIIRRIFARAG